MTELPKKTNKKSPINNQKMKTSQYTRLRSDV